METIQVISKEMKLSIAQVSAVATLLDQGNTVPFIARYRKEKTGSLDEVAIAAIRDQIEILNALSDRKNAILKSLKERDLLTQTLLADVQAASLMTDLEDLYEKYRPKKRTRAQMAKEKGLEPLSIFLLEQLNLCPLSEARNYISSEKQVESAEAAIEGARDIVAEIINEDVEIRTTIRKLFVDTAQIQSRVQKGKETQGIKFKDYFDWSELAFKAPSK